jgi:hypothetical protein
MLIIAMLLVDEPLDPFRSYSTPSSPGSYTISKALKTFSFMLMIAYALSFIHFLLFNKAMPSDQVSLLNLWTALRISFEEKKQLCGAPLTIIGKEVDPNHLTFTLPEKAKQNLLAYVEDFCLTSKHSCGAKFILCEWQHLAGWLNWSFNVFPLLRPCLNNFYPKISGKDHLNAEIWVNNIVYDNLH